MIEPEVAFTDINDNMDLAESLTCFVINRVLERRADDMDLFDRFVDKGWWIASRVWWRSLCALFLPRGHRYFESERKEFRVPRQVWP